MRSTTPAPLRLSVALLFFALLSGLTGCGDDSAASRPPAGPLPVFDPVEADVRAAVDELGRRLLDVVTGPVPRTNMEWARHWDAITAPGYGGPYAGVWMQAGPRCYPDPGAQSPNHYLPHDSALELAFGNWQTPARPEEAATALAHFRSFQQALMELDRATHPRPQDNTRVAQAIVTVVAAYEALRTTLGGTVPVQPSNAWFETPCSPSAPPLGSAPAPSPSAGASPSVPACPPVVAVAATTQGRVVPQELPDPFATLPVTANGHP